MATHHTYKGRAIDMQALLMVNEHAVALGNANMNARGDILGEGGQIIRTSEQITEEYYQLNAVPAVDTDEDLAIEDDYVSEFDASLLEGYDEEEAIEPEVVLPVEEAPKPRRRKAPAKTKE